MLQGETVEQEMLISPLTPGSIVTCFTDENYKFALAHTFADLLPPVICKG